MRNEISDLIRRTIYEDLIDGKNTAKYPNICGAQHKVYFIDYNHPEDSFGDSGIQSHVNMHEVKMVVEMVKYFVKNGYTKYEDIAVLTPYSGQLIKIKNALSKSFSIEIDERDAENIAYMEREENNTSKPLNQRVTLRTVDNFQAKKWGDHHDSRLSSDSDLLNVHNPASWRVSHTIGFDPSLWIGKFQNFRFFETLFFKKPNFSNIFFLFFRYRYRLRLFNLNHQLEHLVTPPPDTKLSGCGQIDVERLMFR
ncbi:unnamed protein product [Rhizophagus irregularis]|uniref:DNA2/NAM7 helicase-like C-terminal domain-containing protein n=1 Tax=Rhizophagus irregularis TaxID=588596 RepID=A0A915YPY9_9GLOM|nr:unnamed protein product [Rhizophagus irregularis]